MCIRDSDLTERSADLTPRFAGCDARVVFRVQFGALPQRDPLFQMQQIYSNS